MRKMEWNGKQVNAQPLEFEAVAPEKFTYYKAWQMVHWLRPKVVLTELCRVEGEFHSGTENLCISQARWVMIITEAKADRMQDAVVSKPQW